MTEKTPNPQRQLAATKQAVVKVLRAAGLYLPELTYQVEMLAADLLLYRKATEAVLSLKSFTIFENSITKAHPSVGIHQNAAAQLRSDLNALLMNYQKKTGKKQPDTQREQQSNLLEKLMDAVPK